MSELVKTNNASKALVTPAYQKKMLEILQDPKKVERLTTAVCGALAVNPDLNKCEPSSILSCAILGEGLNLTPSPHLGRYYMVPFTKNKGKVNEISVATFILGFKGYLELAKRTGQYKFINALEVKEGEFKGFDRLTEELKLEFVEDDKVREKLETIGYVATFQELNGFTKTLYWTKDKMLEHADRYSPAFSLNGNTAKVSYADFVKNNYPKKDSWKYSSFWYQNFDEMAKKTMLRQIISKWGNMSVEMEKAYAEDGKIINSDGSSEYIQEDNTSVINPFAQEVENEEAEIIEAEFEEVKEETKKDKTEETPQEDMPEFLQD